MNQKKALGMTVRNYIPLTVMPFSSKMENIFMAFSYQRLYEVKSVPGICMASAS